MSKHQTTIVLCLTAVFIILGFGMFIAWDLNPGAWTPEGRYFTVCSAIIVIIITLIARN
jgi:hypothetical protein